MIIGRGGGIPKKTLDDPHGDIKRDIEIIGDSNGRKLSDSNGEFKLKYDSKVVKSVLDRDSKMFKSTLKVALSGHSYSKVFKSAIKNKSTIDCDSNGGDSESKVFKSALKNKSTIDCDSNGVIPGSDRNLISLADISSKSDRNIH